MKKALILGGSGGLSGKLAELAKKEYEEVWVLTRGRKKLEEGYCRLVADRDDESAFRKAILGANTCWDVVFDCICMNEQHAKQDLEIVAQKTNRLIVISTDSVYASEYKTVLQKEEGIFVGDRFSKTEIPSYAINKRKMERTFEAYFSDSSNKCEEKLQITIFRPGHIFGPGFLFGCFPMQSRQEHLPGIMEKGKIALVGGGCYLIHPIYVEDLARVMLDCVTNKNTFQEIFCIGGPEIIENQTYYHILGNIIGKQVKIEEIPLTGFLEKYPEYYGHLCHRAYDLRKLQKTGIELPSTTLKEGLEKQYEYWKRRKG